MTQLPPEPGVPAHWGRAYTAPDVTVYYDARRCIHFAACVRGDCSDAFSTTVLP